VDFVTDINPKILGLLSPEAAVDLFRELLWAEAYREGIGPALISVPTAITAADGGIDAEITGVPLDSSGGLFFSGLTRYQIKTGAFSAGNDSEMKALFLKEKSTEFKDRVRTCFEKNGTFVVVLFGSDSPNRTDDELVRACKDFIGRFEPAFQNCSLHVFQQNQIAAFLNHHLPLASHAQMKSFRNLRIHREWGAEIESLAPLRVGAPQEGFIGQIREELRQQAVVSHLCIWGEPGIGKTRLLYEATSTEDMSSSVAYFRSPHALEQSGVIDELVHNTAKSAIVVVDECDSRDRENIWRQLRGLGSRVRLVTVQHDPCESSGTTVALQIPALAQAQISEIIQQHGVSKADADRFAEYCGGSPRVADVVGWNLRNNPDDLTRPLDTGNVWDRFVIGADSATSDLARHRKLILSYIALFKKFGYGRPYQDEARAIADHVAKADPSITWARFQEILKSLRERRILQGETTLYITPKLLHIKLWSDWWALYGNNLNVEQFLGTIPDTLHLWFYDMFTYAHGSDTIAKTVRGILSRHGSFLRDGLVKTELGANFFLNLTEADTEAALDFLEFTIGQEGRKELLEFKAGRQRIVWALEKIAVERPLFQRAARVLLRLAEAENEPKISNNATGTFASLFSLGPGGTAPSQAPPAERFPVLSEALTAESSETRAVALRACDQALRAHSFSRTYGAERRGLRDLDLWSPKTYDEWYDAYREVWKMLALNIVKLSGEEQSESVRILLKHSFDLVQVAALADLVTSTIESLVDVPSVSRKAILEIVVDVLQRLTSLPEAIRSRWEILRKNVTGGDSYAGRLKSLLILPAWRVAPVSEFSTEPWRHLAEEAFSRRDEFTAQLDWLTSAEAESAVSFGYELGRLDGESIFQDAIIHAVERMDASGNPGILGGYLRARHEADPTRWLETVGCLSQRAESIRLFPTILMQSGLNDGAAAVLTDLVKRKEFPAYYLQGFVYGGEIRNLTVGAFASWLNLLLSENDQRASIAALQLLHHYELHDERGKLSPDLIRAVLLHDTLFEKEADGSRGSHRDYDWSEVARKFLEDHPALKLVFAGKLLQKMGKDSVVLPRFGHSYADQLLSEIASEFPSEIWKIAAPFLGPPIDQRSHAIMSWLKGGEHRWGNGQPDSILSRIPLQDLWAWVDDNVDLRAWYLASFVPKLTAELTLPDVVRELLIRYGDRDDVQRNLAANFSSEGWAGPASEHYRSKKEVLDRLLAKELEPRVREWLQQYIVSLQRSVEHARTEEEREDF
jgi:hypothetical protein